MKNQKLKIKNFTFLFVIFIFTFYILHFPTPAYADVKIGEFFGYGGIESLGKGTSQLVMPTFSLAAVIIVIYFLVGAYKYLTSGGNKEEVEGARQMITHAIIGFILLMFAFLILQFLMSRLFGTTFFSIF